MGDLNFKGLGKAHARRSRTGAPALFPPAEGRTPAAGAMSARSSEPIPITPGHRMANPAGRPPLAKLNALHAAGGAFRGTLHGDLQ